MGWAIDAGPIHLSDEGVAVKPQFKVGYADDNVNVRAGVEDVRDGLSAAIAGDVHRTYEAEGHGLNEALGKLKNKSNIKVVDDIISGAPKLLSQVMQTANVRIADEAPVSVKMTVKGGLGVSGAVCLGWANTDGFHMVGVRGSISASVGVGGDMVVGRHATKPQVKCILGLPNVCMELVFENVENVSQPQKVDTEGPDNLGDGVELEDASKDALAMTL